MLSALATQNGDNNYSPPVPGVGTPGDVHPDNAVHYSGRPDADRGRNKDNNYYEGQRLRMVALLPVPGPPRQRGSMQIAEAIAEQMGCEQEQRGNTALGERLGKAWGRVSRPSQCCRVPGRWCCRLAWNSGGGKLDAPPLV